MLRYILEEDGDPLRCWKDPDGGPEVERSVIIDKFHTLPGHGLGVASTKGIDRFATEDLIVVLADDAAAAADDLRAGAVEIGEDPVAVHQGDAISHGFEDLLEALGGLALELACGVGDGDLGGEIFCEPRVFYGDGSLRGDGGDEGLALLGEDARLGVAEEHGAEDMAGAAHDRHGEMTAHGEVSVRHSVEGRVVAVAGILCDVGGAEDAGVNEALGEDGGGP